MLSGCAVVLELSAVGICSILADNGREDLEYQGVKGLIPVNGQVAQRLVLILWYVTNEDSGHYFLPLRAE